ncbi:MAG: MgtC/SapB family protein [Limnohabitans sp.]
MRWPLTPDFLFSIVLALLLGSLVGVERQWHRRLVDLKTNALVALGACLFMLLCRFPAGLQEPIRMAGQIVVGVGFLGGGILFREGGLTKGLNTAATLWCSAAVGAFCGMDRWADAVGAAITIVLANTLLRRVAQFLNLRMGGNDTLNDAVEFAWVCAIADAAQVRAGMQAFFESTRCEVRQISQESWGEGRVQLSMTVLFEHGEFAKTGQRVDDFLAKLPVIHTSWRLR